MALTMMKQMIGMSREGAVLLTLLLAVALPQPVLAEPVGIAPKAQQLLKASTDFLAGQQQFSLDTSSSIEKVEAGTKRIKSAAFLHPPEHGHGDQKNPCDNKARPEA